MTKIEALKELAAKVEAGQFIPRFDGPEHRVWPGMEGMNSWKRHHARYSYHGSLDAAKALHDAVLPKTSQFSIVTDPTCIKVTVHAWPNGLSESDEIHGEAWSQDNPARAWLLAIIRALIAQEESNG